MIVLNALILSRIVVVNVPNLKYKVFYIQFIPLGTSWEGWSSTNEERTSWPYGNLSVKQFYLKRYLKDLRDEIFNIRNIDIYTYIQYRAHGDSMGLLEVLDPMAFL